TAPAADPRAGSAVTTEAGAGHGGAVRAPVMKGDDLHIFVVAPPSDVFVLDTQVREMNMLVEVRQVVFERPHFDLARVAIGVAVVVLALRSRSCSHSWYSRLSS